MRALEPATNRLLIYASSTVAGRAQSLGNLST
jgi:hypothetical protein